VAVAPAATRFKGDETAFMLDRPRARLLFCSTSMAGTGHRIREFSHIAL